MQEQEPATASRTATCLALSKRLPRATNKAIPEGFPSRNRRKSPAQLFDLAPPASLKANGLGPLASPQRGLSLLLLFVRADMVHGIRPGPSKPSATHALHQQATIAQIAEKSNRTAGNILFFFSATATPKNDTKAYKRSR